MHHVVTQTNKKNNPRRTIVGVILGAVIIFFIAGGIWLAGRKDTQISADSGEDGQDISVWGTDEEYGKFEELFRKYQDHMQIIRDELTNILGETDYVIMFDEKVISGNLLRECIKILYNNNTFVSEGNEELTNMLNENAILIAELNFLKEEGVITSIDQIFLEKYMSVVLFYINTEFTPFITTNNGVENSFAYIEYEECKKYGYKNIEGNWYMWISPPPE